MRIARRNTPCTSPAWSCNEERKVKRALVSARNDLQLRARRACVLVVVGVRVRGVDVVRWERSFAKVI